ncbi:MAG: hypothetical protein JWM36_2454 [Hyphomicrobiales bacterium]|nr:hypothetical protein [Hyphomicrobiales bacterium]
MSVLGMVAQRELRSVKPRQVEGLRVPAGAYRAANGGSTETPSQPWRQRVLVPRQSLRNKMFPRARGTEYPPCKWRRLIHRRRPAVGNFAKGAAENRLLPLVVVQNSRMRRTYSGH